MKNLLILVMFFLLAGCGQDMNNPQKIKLNWDVSSVESYGFFELGKMDKVSEDDLKKKKKIIIRDERLTALFGSAHYDKRSALWKGGKLALVRLKDGRTLRIAISNYGGYFYLIGQSGYYFFKNQDRELWEYLFSGEGLKESIRKSK